MYRLGNVLFHHAESLRLFFGKAVVLSRVFLQYPLLKISVHSLVIRRQGGINTRYFLNQRHLCYHFVLPARIFELLVRLPHAYGPARVCRV